jgi:hypothetical protein
MKLKLYTNEYNQQFNDFLVHISEEEISLIHEQEESESMNWKHVLTNEHGRTWVCSVYVLVQFCQSHKHTQFYNEQKSYLSYIKQYINEYVHHDTNIST